MRARMSSKLFVGGVASLGLLLASAACGGADPSPAGEAPVPDAGNADTSSGGNPDDDGGTAPTLPADTLAEGDVILNGLAGDDAIYIDLGQNSLHAVPIAGGAAVKIADLTDDSTFEISGGAVAVWTGITGTGAATLGTLNVWTRATGYKTAVATSSRPGSFFAASDDGSRIAFSQGIVVDADKLTSVPIGVRDTAAGTNAVTLTDANAINFAADDCPPAMGFAGKVFFAQFCTGTDESATDARLVTVAATGTTVDRLDAAAADPGTLKPGTFSPDDTGTKVFAIASANSAGKVFTIGGAAATFETDIELGVMLPDGSAVIFQTTAGALKKATAVEAPVVTTLAPSIKGLLALAPNGKNLIFHVGELEETDHPELYAQLDLHALDPSAATPAPTALVPSSTAFPASYNGAATHFLFFGDITETSAKLKSIPIGGGTAKDVADTDTVFPAETGTDVVFTTNPQEVGPTDEEFVTFDLKHVDSVAGGAAELVALGVPSGETMIKGKRVVYSRVNAQGKGIGIFGATLP